MNLVVRQSHDTDWLVAALADADEGTDRIRQTVTDPANTSHEAWHDGSRIGALVMRWHPDESEIVYIAVDSSQRGEGYGKAIIAWVVEEARRRAVRSLIVGTANAGLDNIAFYQKCGFRIDSVRKDYFDYFTEPVYENGIQIRDMLVLRFALDDN